MFKTRMTEMLGIKYPILAGGMQWLSRAEFVAAVSNAGGLGFITALSFGSKDDLREEIKKTKTLTDKPFGVNISMLPVITSDEFLEPYVDVVIDEGIPAVETSGRNPEPFVERLKKAGVKIIHKVPAIRFAKKAESVGVDAVTIVGFECGGHPGMDDVPSLILIQKAAQSLKIPVVAAGGFSNAQSFLAALALGAEAVVMGTRFVASKECIIHPNFKEWIVNANETDTMIIERSIRNAARVMKNEAAKKVFEMEQEGATLEDFMTIISGKVGREAYTSGNIDGGIFACGQAIGLINSIMSIKEIFEEIGRESESALKRLNSMAGNA